MCLLIGPTGAGKTVLLKKLQYLSTNKQSSLNSDKSLPSTIPTAKIARDGGPHGFSHPTDLLQHLSEDYSIHRRSVAVGTNLVTLPLPRKVDLTVRELGGSIVPIWNNYYQDCSSVLFVIDVSNPLQIAAACIQFLTVLTDSKLMNKPLLLVINKVDVQNHMTDTEIENVFHLKEILHHSGNHITVVRVSCYTGRGLSDVLQWLQVVSR